MSYNGKHSLELLKNFFQMPTVPRPTTTSIRMNNTTGFNRSAGGSLDPVKNLGNTAIPVPPTREIEDISGWRDAIIETERSFLPFRVKMQEIFRDTYLNTQVFACVNKRRNLTLLRKFSLFDTQGKPQEEWTRLLDTFWFRKFLTYSLDALFYGYSLISLGDLIDGGFPELTIIRRDNIVPDREVPYVSSAPYLTSGASWIDEPLSDWHIWVPTPTEHGTAFCGFGLFYPLANIEINIRNLLGFNMDYLQMFGSPLRVINMPDVNNETERAAIETALQNQGSANYIMLDKDADMKYLGATVGSGYKSYADADIRFEKKISKILLGHEDAISSTPGKLGGGQGGSKQADSSHSPIQEALDEIQQSDANFLAPIINNLLLPKLRLHGIDIPEGFYFKFLNSDEEEQIKSRNADLGLKLSQQVNFLEGSNIEIDPEWFQNETGIKVKTVQRTTENNEEKDGVSSNNG